MTPPLCIAVAMAQNRVIGRDNDMPWHIPEDLRRFKALTLGKPVIMGRKTFESILARLGKPLPGRTNIVVSRKGLAAAPPGATVCDRFDAALETAQTVAAQTGAAEIFVIGGAQIYARALPQVERIYRTDIEVEMAGDALFPPLDPQDWEEIACEAAREPCPFPVFFRTLHRRR